MENIQVVCRLRPLNEEEKSRGEFVPWRVKQNTIEISKQDSAGENPGLKKPTKYTFAFDHCFGDQVTNDQIYQTTSKNVVMSCLDGYNGTLFMYGQTGSGKTYTMLGYNSKTGLYNSAGKQDINQGSDSVDDHMGIEGFEEKYPDYIYHSTQASFESNTGILIQGLKDIFKAIEMDKEKTYFLKCSYFEIYNDQIYDLLKPRGALGEPLPLVEDVKNDSFVIKGITTESVGSIKEIFEKLKRGELNRHYAETYMNHSSSRSHCLFRLQIKALTNAFVKAYRQQNTDCANVNVLNNIDVSHEGTIVTESYLNFVDLAGNERMSAHIKGSAGTGEDEDYGSGQVNSRINEGKHINKSLFFLTHVISLKAEGKANQHIPFRNSPLTKILRSSLGGNFRTAVVLCLNPTNSQIEVSLSTLRFGQNAKKIQNKVKANIITNNNEETIRVLVESYERRIRELQMQHEMDFSRYDQYINIIDELKLQRTSLLERLETANKKLALKIAEEIPENELQRFFWSVNHQAAYFNSPGLLFTSQKLAKFEEFDPEEHEWDTSPTHKTADRMKKKFKKEMDPITKAQPSCSPHFMREENQISE